MKKPAIILVNPQMGENIGAAARAMANFGLSDLRLVKPRDGWPNPQANTMSAGALDILPPVQVFETLPEACAGLHFVLATTARKREVIKPVYTPAGAIEEIITRAAQTQTAGLVFGAERAGLSNEDIAVCHAIINIPANPDFSSLNLGQSVLLLGYEWLRQTSTAPARQLDTGDSFPAEHERLEEFLVRLEDELQSHGFFRTPEMRPTMIQNIRAFFTRSVPTDQEVRTLQGIVSALIGKNCKS